MKKILLALSFCLTTGFVYADSKLSALTEYLTPKATDFVYVISNNGVSYKTQFGSFLSAITVTSQTVTTALILPDGSLGNPSFGFASSTGAGFYYDPGANIVYFQKMSGGKSITIFEVQSDGIHSSAGKSIYLDNSATSLSQPALIVNTGAGLNPISGVKGINFISNNQISGATLNDRWILNGASFTTSSYGSVSITSSAIVDWVALSVSSTPDPSSRFYILSSTRNYIGVPVTVSSFTSNGTITGTFIGNGAGITGITASAAQSLPLIANDTGYATIYATKTWTATQNFTNPINILDVNPIVNGSVAASIYSIHFASLQPTAVVPAVYGYNVNTGSNTATVGHGIGGLFRSSDTENGHINQFGLEGRADVYGDSVYRGVLGYAVGIFPKITGSTATMYGVEARVQAYDADGTTPKSTATIASLYIPAIVGGASDRKWSVYQAGTTDPAYFGSPVGIGVTPYGTGVKLHISDANNPNIAINDSDNGVTLEAGASGLAGGYTWIGSTSPHPFLVAVGNSEAMRFDTSKNLGINTSAPTNKLSVIGSVDVSSLSLKGTITSTSGFIVGDSTVGILNVKSLQVYPDAAQTLCQVDVFNNAGQLAWQTQVGGATSFYGSVSFPNAGNFYNASVGAGQFYRSNTVADGLLVSYDLFGSNQNWTGSNAFKSSTTMNVVVVDSMTVYGTITSTSDLRVHTASATYFFGNGAGITGITASGGASTLGIFKDEAQITSPTIQLNFKGTGVTVADAGTGTATITINGGSFDATASQNITGAYLFKTSVTVQNGTEYPSVYISTDNHVGIGISTPSAELEVRSTSTFEAQGPLVIFSTGNGVGGKTYEFNRSSFVVAGQIRAPNLGAIVAGKPAYSFSGASNDDYGMYFDGTNIGIRGFSGTGVGAQTWAKDGTGSSIRGPLTLTISGLLTPDGTLGAGNSLRTPGLTASPGINLSASVAGIGFTSYQSTGAIWAGSNPVMYWYPNGVMFGTNKIWGSGGIVAIATESANDSMNIPIFSVSSTTKVGPIFGVNSASITATVQVFSSSDIVTTSFFRTAGSGKFVGDGSLLTNVPAGGASTLGVFKDEVQITSPTIQINFKGTGVTVVANGSTATVTIGAGSFDNTSTQTITGAWTFRSTTTFTSTATFSQPVIFSSSVIGLPFTYVFNAEQARSTNVVSCAVINNSTDDFTASLLFDDTLNEDAMFSTILSPYKGGNLKADIFYTMTSAITGNVVDKIQVYCSTGGAASAVKFSTFSADNTGTFAVPTSAGFPSMGTVNLDSTAGSCVDGAMAIIHVWRNGASGSDDASGDQEIRKIKVYEK
jgi:hypothetical protein